MADYLVQEGGAATDRLLTESGGLFLLEDDTGDILLESSSTGGTGRFTLEDGTGFILLETGIIPPPPTPVNTGGITIVRRLHKQLRVAGHLEDDEAIALSLLLRTRRRFNRDDHR